MNKVVQEKILKCFHESLKRAGEQGIRLITPGLEENTHPSLMTLGPQSSDEEIELLATMIMMRIMSKVLGNFYTMDTRFAKLLLSQGKNIEIPAKGLDRMVADLKG